MIEGLTMMIWNFLGKHLNECELSLLYTFCTNLCIELGGDSFLNFNSVIDSKYVVTKVIFYKDGRKIGKVDIDG